MLLPNLRQGVEDFLHLFYPHLCLACRRHLPSREEIICLRCTLHLPRTYFHHEKENPFTERFWGRLPLESGAALFHYVKGGRVQQLIHQLKYHGKREVGYRLGRWYGRELRESPFFSGIDLIVPVPLQPRK